MRERGAMQADYDEELKSYFTDVEHLLNLFREWLAALELPKRMLVIHGVGGVGKTSLLRMFRLHARSVRVPIALASGDEHKSAPDVLIRWADDLIADGVRLPAFTRTLARYRALLSRAEDEAAKVATKAAKEAVKTATETALSLIPGIGPILSKLGGIGVEALTDWLFSRGFKKPEIDLILNPEEKLTKDFLSDVTKAAGRRRLVLMLDTFEQITTLSDWVREVAQQLPSNVLLVVAGRVTPDWERNWPGWMTRAHVEELKLMTEDHMRELIRRYYARIRGGEPDPKQVESIVAFARGLPLIAASVVNTWVRFPETAGNFQAAKPRVVDDFVRYLLDGVPKALVPVLEAAAILRWFDEHVLQSILTEDEIHYGYQAIRARAPMELAETEVARGSDYALRCIYDEILRFPFVRSRTEGFFFHDAVREIMDEHLRIRNPERYRALHERAAIYFEAQLEKAREEEAERLMLERLYHRICADEETGIKLFREIAEALVRHPLDKLIVLLNDVRNYPLKYENSKLWCEYYNARLLAAQTKHLEAIPRFEAIANSTTDRLLRLYAIGRLGMSLGAPEILNEPRHAQRAVAALYQSSMELPKQDPSAVHFYSELLTVHRRLGNWEEVNKLYPVFLEMVNSLEGSERAQFISHLKGLFGTIGNWREFLRVQENLQNISPGLNHYEAARALAHWIFPMFWMGRYFEAELVCQKGFDELKRLGYESLTLLRDLAQAAALQGKFQEAEVYRLRWSERFQKADYFTTVARKRITAIALGFWGVGDRLAGRFREARHKLVYSLWIKRRLDESGVPEVLVALGNLYETLTKLAQAENYYLQCLKLRWTGRRYFECGALTGLVRVRHAQGDYASIPPLLTEAEQLAQQYEYNDHLASLRLTQGHIAWEGNAPAWENGFDAALRYYQQALIYALRYNRFLLDEVLSGRPQGTPLRPIIPECLKRGEEGRRMLIALRDWWQTGINDVGAPRPDTISPIPEGIPLLEAERIAREREPGDGSPQRSVVEQIENALSTYLP